MKKRQHHSLKFVAVSVCFLALMTNNTLAVSEPSATQNEQTIKHARVTDIIAQASGHKLQILVSMDAQPKTAATIITDEGCKLSIKGVQLTHKNVIPLTNMAVSQAIIAPTPNSQSTEINFTTSDIDKVETQIYKNAILVSANLVNAVPIANNHKQVLHKTNTTTNFKGTFGLSQNVCEKADAAIKLDSWNLDALADQALCLIAANDLDRAEPIIAQLKNFAADNWKLHLANGELLRLSGNTSEAQISFQYAIQHAQAEKDRAAIRSWMQR